MLPCLWGQVNSSLKNWLSNIGLGNTSKSLREFYPTSSYLDTCCPGLG